MFLVGGGGKGSRQVQSINFDWVTDLADAKQKQWVILGSLTSSVYKAGVQFFKHQLFILSSPSGSPAKNVQCFDLLTNTTKISGV